MQDKFIEEIKELKDGELIELYNKICDHISYLSSSIIEVVEPERTDNSEDDEGGEDDGDE